MQLTSEDFEQGGPISVQFTCEGDDISPEFSWRDAPLGTRSLVLTMRDPDAPREGSFTHWVVYNIPASIGHIEQNVPKQPAVPGLGLQGTNDAGGIGYVGPCPPSGMHRYFVQLYALDTELSLPRGPSYQEVRSAMEGHILGRAELVGTYAAEQAA
jgi:Raf kinase inhibitor-like YbhB/YbcL family protein